MDIKKRHLIEINHKKFYVSEEKLNQLLPFINQESKEFNPPPLRYDMKILPRMRTDGWFDFNNFYDFIINKFNNATFVEIGTWKGMSIIYLAKNILKSNKNIKIFGIDTFKGNAGIEEMEQDKDIINGTLYSTYCKNIEPYKDIIDTIVGNSQDVYVQFEDESIDFLFIDGDHRYEGIKKDLELWYPKVKKGGIISGHDYLTAPGVKQAVNEHFTSFKLFETYQNGNNVWYYNKI